MPLKLNATGGGSVSIDPPATVSNFTATMPAATGTVVLDSATQTLTNKSWSSPASSTISSGTAQASTSGTSIDFTSIPSWIKRVTVMFNGVSTNGTSDVIVQLGTSAGFVATGYLGAAVTTTTGTAGASNLSTGFLARMGTTAGTAAAIRHGHAVFTLIGSDTWICSLTIGLSNTDYLGNTAGTIALPGTLTQVRITTAGGVNTFDAGSINILYE